MKRTQTTCFATNTIYIQDWTYWAYTDIISQLVHAL